MSNNNTGLHSAKPYMISACQQGEVEQVYIKSIKYIFNTITTAVVNIL